MTAASDTGAMGNQRGSALMLMPAAVLVVFVLAAIAVDQSLIFVRQRDLVAAAQAAANDAAGFGLDADVFYTENRIEFDLGRAQQAASAALTARGYAMVPSVTLDPTGTRVLVVVHDQVDPFFAGAIPGGGGSTEITGRASAELEVR